MIKTDAEKINTVLVIGYVWPEPNSSAAGSHMLSLLKLFGEQNWQVYFASAAEQTPHQFDLNRIGVHSKTIELNDSSFDEYLNTLQPDAVLFDRFFIEEQFGWRVTKQCPSALRLLDTEDMHSLRNARHQALKQNRLMETADLMGDMAQREVAAIYRSDLTLMISDFEIELLTQTFSVPDSLLMHCPFMLNTSDIGNTPLPEFNQRQHFISIGNFRHEPNWDVVRYLKETIWPLIRQQLPDAELHIYGAYPPPKATALDKKKEGFRVLGWADDAFAVMRNARVNLAPLRFGAGIKGKLADGMLCGTPSVTTPIGAEAMTAGLTWGGTIADDPQHFADAAVALYCDQAAWQQAQADGFAIARSLFDKTLIGNRVITRINTVYQQLEQHRLNNFTGAMLRHHHHRSTQFMGQWIESKNRLAQLQASLQDQ